MVRALLRSYQGTPREAVQFFDAALAENKYNNEVAARYGLVASLLRAQDLTRAKTELATLEKIAPPHPMIEAMAGHVLHGERRPERWRSSASTRALQRYPNKLQLVSTIPRCCSRRIARPTPPCFSSAELVRFPDNGPMHRHRRAAYAELGKKMQQHRHQGEYYAWQGDLKGAITQLELASKASDGDFYQSSVVETRLRVLRRESQRAEGAGEERMKLASARRDSVIRIGRLTHPDLDRQRTTRRRRSSATRTTCRCRQVQIRRTPTTVSAPPPFERHAVPVRRSPGIRRNGEAT